MATTTRTTSRANRPGSRRRPSTAVAQVADPRDGSIHDEYVYAGWEKLSPRKRYGKAVPRLWTPSLRELTPETSLGFDVINFARDVLRQDLLPWQRWLAIHMLELRVDGSLRFRKAIVLVARQNGKSTFMQILALYMMIAEAWPLTLGTAQDLGTAEEVWEDVVSTLDDDPELAGFVKKVTKVNGKKSLLLTTGERYLVKAANRRAGRGLRGNLVILDELREQQTWAAWAAISKTTNAQRLALVVGISNAGDITSVVLWYLRLRAHRALGDPDGIDVEGDLLAAATPGNVEAAIESPYLEKFDVDVEGEDDGEDDEFYDDELDENPFDDEDDDDVSLGLFEWSAAPNLDRMDKDGWAQANPSLGHVMEIRAIASDAKDDPEWVFRTEVLCQWANTSLSGPFPAGSWERGQNHPVVRPDGSYALDDSDRIVGQFDVCIEQTADRSMYSLIACGKRPDGVDQVELIAYRSGSDWIADFLLHDERCRGRVRRVTGQTRGAPVSAFMADLADKYANPADPWMLEVVPWLGADLTIACAILSDAVVGTPEKPEPTVRHNVQPILDTAAGTAVVKQLSGGWVVDRDNSPADAAPLMGAAGALWLSRKHAIAPPPPPPPPRAVRSADTSLTRQGPSSLTSDLRNVGF
ncbi:hypothetical protein [Curtobacterium sp. MCBD17_028]|uniref:hypothetical protein n=1 Tax=Curtobacterium sp. MCBD17_028 TaxID=2175670 RepID=UPI000DAACA1D|nr:hypothetical protein [Curtobacterium sp. MCBD17_028]PZE23864.1 hypothetical protein DEI86_13555 [Curtobacterium sp. MCBD17_028]